jgi:hypothetical protein
MTEPEPEPTPEAQATYAALAAQTRKLTYGEWTTQSLSTTYENLRREPQPKGDQIDGYRIYPGVGTPLPERG